MMVVAIMNTEPGDRGAHSLSMCKTRGVHVSLAYAVPSLLTPRSGHLLRSGVLNVQHPSPGAHPSPGQYPESRKQRAPVSAICALGWADCPRLPRFDASASSAASLSPEAQPLRAELPPLAASSRCS